MVSVVPVSVTNVPMPANVRSRLVSKRIGHPDPGDGLAREPEVLNVFLIT